jgi:glycosyltransferase involved in cell wall biosynthesis
MKLSATIITRNEEKNIRDCLASLDFADEIVVVDSGSTDRTEEICRSHPKVRFFHHEWAGYGKQKNVAADCASHDWILNLDADERVSPVLRHSIESAEPGSFSAARMARENYFGKHWIRHCGWFPDYNYRFYNRKQCRFSERIVHETLVHDGNTTTLEGNLIHFTYENISDYLRRMDTYSTLSAQELLRSGKTTGIASLMFKPLATFVKMYFIKRGFLEGYTGLTLSLLYAQYTFCKYAKLAELRNISDVGNVNIDT